MRYFFVYVGSGLIRLKCCISPRSPARPTGSVYSGTLSGMRARLYLNSMVAFSAALSAAPRWNEPAWVGVSKGLEVRLAGRGHCWRWLTCWRLDDGCLYWEVGALLRGDGGAQSRGVGVAVRVRDVAGVRARADAPPPRARLAQRGLVPRRRGRLRARIRAPKRHLRGRRERPRSRCCPRPRSLRRTTTAWVKTICEARGCRTGTCACATGSPS